MKDYKLVQKTGEEVGMFKITIVADSGDGDYVTDTDLFPKKEFEEYGLEGLRDLRSKASLRHQLRDYDNTYELPIPFNFRDGSCHTLESVTVEYLDEDGRVWTVEY